MPSSGECWSHWTYDAAEWQRWASAVRRRTKPISWGIAVALPAGCAALGALLYAAEYGAERWPMAATALLCGGATMVVPVILLTANIRLAQLIARSKPEAFVGPDGVRQFGRHIRWGKKGIRLTNVEVTGQELIFRFTQNLWIPEPLEERVLIPPGHEREASELRNRLIAWHRLAKTAP